MLLFFTCTRLFVVCCSGASLSPAVRLCTWPNSKFLALPSPCCCSSSPSFIQSCSWWSLNCAAHANNNLLRCCSFFLFRYCVDVFDVCVCVYVYINVGPTAKRARRRVLKMKSSTVRSRQQQSQLATSGLNNLSIRILSKTKCSVVAKGAHTVGSGIFFSAEVNKC